MPVVRAECSRASQTATPASRLASKRQRNERQPMPAAPSAICGASGSAVLSCIAKAGQRIDAGDQRRRADRAQCQPERALVEAAAAPGDDRRDDRRESRDDQCQRDRVLGETQSARAHALGALPGLGNEDIASGPGDLVAGDRHDHARLAALADVDARIGVGELPVGARRPLLLLGRYFAQRRRIEPEALPDLLLGERRAPVRATASRPAAFPAAGDALAAPCRRRPR